MSESGSFETDGAGYLRGEGAPAAKRSRFALVEGAVNHGGGEEEILNVETTECEGGEVEVADAEPVSAIAVPQTQFEIEINSSQPSEEVVEVEGGEELKSHDIAGPSFTVIQDTQDLSSLGAMPLKPAAQEEEVGGALAEESTLNAIGRALIQMQQQQQQLASGIQPPTAASAPGHQLIITSPQVSGQEAGQASGAPLYVMIPPSSSAEILQAMGQTRPIVPKLSTSPNGSSAVEAVQVSREQQRKATHNEVERRRRDRINDLIKTLAQVVPGCQKKDTNTGNVIGYVYSKGTVLDKTVEYIKELRAQNEQLAGTAKLAEKSANALSILQNQITVLEKENAFLRAQIIQLGIDAASNSSGSTANFNRQLLATPLAQSLLNTTVAMPTNLSSPAHQSAAHQLLLSLAQSLTSSPLLTSSPPPASSSTSLSASRLTPSPLPPASTGTPPPPSSHLTPSKLSALTTPLVVSSAAPLTVQLGSLGLPTASPNPALSSLVQTLASIASTTTTQANALPKVSLPPPPPQQQQQQQQQQQGALSASAASNLLNQLNILLATQNVLAGGGASSSAGGGASSVESQNLNSSVLSSVGMETISTEHTAQ